MRKHGIRPALACLKMVMRETASNLASSFAVNARPIRSIRSARDDSSFVLTVGLVPDVAYAVERLRRCDVLMPEHILRSDSVAGELYE